MNVGRFLKGSAVVTAGALVGGVLSYMFSIAMGRLLGPAQFGDFGAISSLLAIFGSAGTAILTVVMHYTAVLRAEQNEQAIRKLQQRFFSRIVTVSLLTIAVLVLATPAIAKAFSISDVWALGVSFTVIVFSLLVTVNRGILQGSQEFLGLSLSTMVEIFAKLVIAVALVWIGMSLMGVAIGMVASMVIAYAMTQWWLRRVLSAKNEASVVAETSDRRKEILQYLWPTAVATLLLLIVMNVDIILVKRFFSPEEAGQYLAVSTVAKIILYVTGPISIVMFPLITFQRTKGEKHYKTLFWSFALTVVVSAVLLILYSLFQKEIIVMLYGTLYGSLADLLPKVAWLAIFISLINLMIQYFMSINQFSFIWFSWPILIGMLVRILYNHSTLVSVIGALQVGTALLFLALLVYYLVTKRSQLINALKIFYAR